MLPLALFGKILPGGNLTRVLIYALVAAALVLCGYVLGQRSVYNDWLEEKGKQAAEAVRIVTRQGAVTEKTVVKYQKEKAKVEQVFITIEKEVPVYVASREHCTVTAGERLLHDAAAAGVVPEATEGFDGTRATGIAEAARATTTIANYKTYHQVRTRLDACQGWIRDQYEATNGVKLND